MFCETDLFQGSLTVSVQHRAVRPPKVRPRGGTMRAVPVAKILDANQVLATLIAFKKGDFTARLPVNQIGLAGKIADVLNDIFELNENMANELARVSTAVGKEGRISQRASLSGGGGNWGAGVGSVNSLISDLVQRSTEIAR